MTARSTTQLAVPGLAMLVGCLLLISACGSPRPAAAGHVAAEHRAAGPAGPVARHSRSSTAHRSSPGRPAIRILAERDRFSACEQRIAREPRDVPTVAIVGASFTAGVGPDVPSLSWAAVLARKLHWNAVIFGVPGAGYVSPAPSGLGPMTRMLGEEGLRGLAPALVIVQAGHNDVGVPAAVERQRVRQVIEEIRAQAPHARIALLTVFTKPYASNLPALDRTDRAIVTAARAADGKAIIMDPLAGRWKFTRLAGIDLHPTAAGDAQIERKVAALLRSHGIGTARSTPTAPVICQYSVGVGAHATPGRGTSKDALSPRDARAYLRRRRPASLSLSLSLS